MLSRRSATPLGDSSLNFVLRFWIRDPQQGLTNVCGKVLLALWDTFKANDISIPYPHREIRERQAGAECGRAGRWQGLGRGAQNSTDSLPPAAVEGGG